MNRHIQQIDEGIFTIANVFSPAECQAAIDRAEQIGFESATVRTDNGPTMMQRIRNNDRVILEDLELASVMWDRIRTSLPILDFSVACGVDKQLRFYRYVPGQQFKRHKDGAVTNELGQTTKLSYLIYLNDDFQGGTTTFRDYVQIDGVHDKIEFSFTPIIGSALLFRHERWHEGTPVLTGEKYVLRSDVFYQQIGDE